jgi:FtsZ-binding cell division protein ZapB
VSEQDEIPGEAVPLRLLSARLAELLDEGQWLFAEDLLLEVSAELSRLRTEAADALHSADVLRESLFTLLRERDNLRAEVETLKAERANLQQQVADLTAKAEQLRVERDTYLNRIGEEHAAIRHNMIACGVEPWSDGRSIDDGKRPWAQHVSMVISALAVCADSQGRANVCENCGGKITEREKERDA